MRSLHSVRWNSIIAARSFSLLVVFAAILLFSGCMGSQDSAPPDTEDGAMGTGQDPMPEKNIGEEIVLVDPLPKPEPIHNLPPREKPPVMVLEEAVPKDIRMSQPPMMEFMPPKPEPVLETPRMAYMHRSAPQNMYLAEGEEPVAFYVEEPVEPIEDPVEEPVVEEDEPDVVSLHYGTNRSLGWGDKDLTSSFTMLIGMLVVSGVGALYFFISAFRRGSVRRGTFALILSLTTLFLADTAWTATQDMALQNSDDKYGVEPEVLSVGTCRVTIPPGHVAGVVERPSPFQWEFVEDRLKHVVVEEIEPLESDAFHQSLRESLGESEKNEVFLFVHGYNQTFEQAAQRTAQIAYDTDFQGTAMFFSWPSQGSLLGYNTDSDYVQTAVEPFREFLTSICSEGRPAKVHILAHSMGNRLVSSSFQGWEVGDHLPEGIAPPEMRLILAAPDVDAEWFKTEVANELPERVDHVTLYTSPNDLALLASQEVNGDPRLGMWRIEDYMDLLSSGIFGSDLLGAVSLSNFGVDGNIQDTDLPNVGDVPFDDPSKYPFPKIESVVFTTGEPIPEKLGHGYYAHHPNIIADLRELISEQKPAAERSGTAGEMLSNGGYVWRIK
jgi:esterase/lipase superfamily enzyme